MSVYQPVTVVEEFVFATLAADSELDGLLGADNIWPGFAHSDVTTMHVTHDFAGPDGGRRAVPLGQGPALLTLDWDVTAWTPGADRQVLDAVTCRVQEVLAGPDGAGCTFTFARSDGTHFAIGCAYAGPVRVSPEINPTWQRVSDRYQISLRQLAGAVT